MKKKRVKADKLSLGIDSPIGKRDFAWVSFRHRDPTNSTMHGREYISIGLKGPEFCIRDTRVSDPTQQAEWDAHLQKLPPGSLLNPHFTYHAPHYYHVQSNGKGPCVWEGLVWAGEGGPLPEERMSWFCATSAPLNQLPETRSTAKRSSVTVQRADCSVRLHVDFLCRSTVSKLDRRTEWLLEWYDLLLGLRVYVVDPQPPSLIWHWQV